MYAVKTDGRLSGETAICLSHSADATGVRSVDPLFAIFIQHPVTASSP